MSPNMTLTAGWCSSLLSAFVSLTECGRSGGGDEGLDERPVIALLATVGGVVRHHPLLLMYTPPHPPPPHPSPLPELGARVATDIRGATLARPGGEAACRAGEGLSTAEPKPRRGSIFRCPCGPPLRVCVAGVAKLAGMLSGSAPSWG